MRCRSAVLALLLGLLSALPAAAGGLPSAKPDEVGLSAARLERVGALLRADVERGRIPGAVVVVARRGRVAYSQAVGFRDKAAATPMTTDSIFRIASMTKPLASVAAMMLYEEGRLLVSDPVGKYIPSIGAMKVGAIDAAGRITTTDVARPMTVQDLLRHTSGLTSGNRGTGEIHKLYPGSATRVSREMTSAEFMERLAKAPLLHQPGTRWEYGASTDVLGRVVEVVSGRTLGQFLAERILGPLKMRDTGFNVGAEQRARLAHSLATDPDTGKPVEMIDVSSPATFECGGGCAVSTALDYVRFGQMLLNHGSLDGAHVLGRKTVEYMTADHLGTEIPSAGEGYLPGAGYGFGLGFAVRRQTGVATVNGSTGDYNWGGAYGTYFWIDPKEQLVVVSMTQAPGPIRVYYRQLLKSLVLQAIND
jgi:CubicO group peptidase (beta-lactamase class C family)